MRQLMTMVDLAERINLSEEFVVDYIEPGHGAKGRQTVSFMPDDSDLPDLYQLYKGKRRLNSHTRIVHCTARLTSLFNTILSRSSSLLRSALACPSFPASYIFRASSGLVYTCVGFNTICGNPYKKVYFSEDMYCANVVRNIRLSYGHRSNVELEHIVRVVSSD